MKNINLIVFPSELERSASASSKIKVATSSVYNKLCSIKSQILPGVPTAIVQWEHLLISSSRERPPIKHWHLIKGIVEESIEITSKVCWAISLVGERTNVWRESKESFSFFSSYRRHILSRRIEEKAIVLPVPDFACAIKSKKNYKRTQNKPNPAFP